MLDTPISDMSEDVFHVAMGSPTYTANLAILISDDGLSRSISKFYVDGSTVYAVDMTIPLATRFKSRWTMGTDKCFTFRAIITHF